MVGGFLPAHKEGHVCVGHTCVYLLREHVPCLRLYVYKRGCVHVHHKECLYVCMH